MRNNGRRKIVHPIKGGLVEKNKRSAPWQIAGNTIVATFSGYMTGRIFLRILMFFSQDSSPGTEAAIFWLGFSLAVVTVIWAANRRP